jgi:hypothetical protein
MLFFSRIQELRNVLLPLFFVAFALAISFPNFEPDYNTGLDSPFRWGFNFLWINDYKTLTQLIFSYGPLAFLKAPVALGNNFFYFLLFYSFTKSSFLFGLIYASKPLTPFFVYPIVLILSYFLQIDTIIIGIVCLGALFYLKKENPIFYAIALFLSIIGLYIKSSIGISCLGITFMMWVLVLIKSPSKKQLTVLIGLSFLLIVLTNLIIGKSFFYFFNYLLNALMLSSEYSSSMALFPSNNWVVLSFSLLSIAIAPFLFERSTTSVFLLLLLPIYSFWKHAMVRESTLYYIQLIEFVLFFWGIILLTSKPLKNKLFFLFPLVSISLFFSNVYFIDKDFTMDKTWNGLPNFSASILNYPQKVADMTQVSTKNVERNKLKSELKERIGLKTIDIYPWDFSYIAANGFNWQPRSSFQSIGVCKWSDKMTQASFYRENGPEFILFQSKKDTFGGELGSIDYRYLLNVEPLTNIQLFKNYDRIQNTKNFTLFQKNESNNLAAPENILSEVASWNEWIDVPKTSNCILKLNLVAEKTLLGKMITFLYKDTQYTIDYQLKSGKMLSYRFIPDIANHGIWINPMLQSLRASDSKASVTQVRFSNHRLSSVKNKLQLNWIIYPILKKEKENLFSYQ